MSLVRPAVVAGLVCGLAAGCSTLRTGGSATDRASALDRAELARCITANAREGATVEAVRSLAGSYRLHLFDAVGAAAVEGPLELWAPAAGDDEAGLAGAAPLLVGATDVELEAVGATPGGDTASRDPAAPGVGAYALSPSEAVLRLGAESNRRDRQRFDGAHTTLSIRSIEAGRFGGTWRSDIGATSGGGDFCAVRAR